MPSPLHQIVGAAIEVHRHLGPGLLEHVYEECLAAELTLQGIPHQRQVQIPFHYKTHPLDLHLRIDLLIEDRVIVELKSVERILPVHLGQLHTYMTLAGMAEGVLINFNVPRLIDGVRKVVRGR